MRNKNTTREGLGSLKFAGRIVREKFYPGTLIKQFRVDECFLLMIDTDEWDNPLLIVLLDASFDDLDRSILSFLHAAIPWTHLGALDESTLEFRFLGRWRLRVLRTPKELVFNPGPMGPLFWVGEPVGEETL